MDLLNFDPDNTLAGGLSAMTPKEAIRLGIGLCAAVEQAVGADGVHGGIWPGNITWADGKAAVGPASGLAVADMDPDELEFISPEQFWSGTTTPASDVYSIALVVYTALNHGVKPYFETAEATSPEARADALQSRMKGETLAYPATAGRALGDVVRRAASFRAEERYRTPGQFRAALEALPEGSDLPAVAPIVALTDEEKQNAPSYKVDKGFEETEPEKPKKEKPKKANKAEGEVDEEMPAALFRDSRRKGRWVLPAVLLAVIAAALFLLLRSCSAEEPEFPMTTEPAATAPAETENLIHAPVQETAAPWEQTEPPAETDVPTETDAPEETDVPTETDAPEETEEPAETDSPAETDAPPAQPRYEIVKANVTWTQARDLAEQAGGHLVTIRSAEQEKEIIELAEANGIRFVWLGAYRDDNGSFRFVTGELMEYADWDVNEPSGTGSAGNPEDYLLLWYRQAVSAWSYNDTVNDVVGVLPRTYSGKIAYVIEYDE